MTVGRSDLTSLNKDLSSLSVRNLRRRVLNKRREEKSESGRVLKDSRREKNESRRVLKDSGEEKNESRRVLKDSREEKNESGRVLNDSRKEKCPKYAEIGISLLDLTGSSSVGEQAVCWKIN